MKSSELRIGNFIKESSIGEFHVYGIYRSELVPRDIILTDFSTGYNEFYIEECEPIKLTEERFERFGFNDNGVFESFRYAIHPRVKGFMIYVNGSYIKSIEYVHQLQNLYFALTGEELISK